MAWLDDNPPRIRQFRCPRRRPISGVIDIHTAESFPDEVGPDTGAENVARFIRDRTNFGSYHDLCDSDSTIHLVRDSCESFSVGTLNLNHHGYAISAATQAHKWNDLGDDWVDATIRRMARAAANFAKRNNLSVPARWLTADQARREVPGFIRHSTADPDRRRDPGTSFPSNTFFAYYLEELGGKPDMDSEQDRMLREVHSFLRTPINRLESTLEDAPPISLRQMLAYTHAWGVRNNAILRTVQPLVEAAGAGQPLSAEQVSTIADQLNRLDVQEVAEAAADTLYDRLEE